MYNQLSQQLSQEERQRCRLREPTRNKSDRARRKRWNVLATADYLAEFTGEFDGYDRWEKQLKLLKEKCQLDEEETKRLAILKLKGKALEWFHLKPEYVAMLIDMLLQ
ncbi:hypothetical protein K0M31_016523 [Melipona bicolor]|uniref:Uncharacterized protein n=1 Tax=Melipona bicolor TaxID=60889 RepID=A0AA40KET5_9HYME|nr:hypothetical protein K0M31_016523 [Melipona bicolor]